MKLIHSGKVLKDGDTIDSCSIKPTDFLVVMITKAKKPPSQAAAAATSAAAAPTSADAAASSAKDDVKMEGAGETKTDGSEDKAAVAAAASSSESSSAAAPAPAPAAASAPAATPAAAAPDEFPAEMVANLTAMGFPEAEVRACLRASGGQPDVAVDFLTGGIPPGAAEAAAAAREQASAPAPAASASDGRPLSALRNHPQFDALKRLVQNNPQMLQTVLAQIGQQQPDLLQEINDNQAAFLEMMNEPISASAPAPAAPPVAPAAPLAAGGGSAHVGPAAMLENLQNPAQMAQMLQAMSPQERQAMAGIMGLSPEQLDQTAQMIAQMPQDQFQAYMQMAMSQGGGMGGIVK